MLIKQVYSFLNILGIKKRIPETLGLRPDEHQTQQTYSKTPKQIYRYRYVANLMSQNKFQNSNTTSFERTKLKSTFMVRPISPKFQAYINNNTN